MDYEGLPLTSDKSADIEKCFHLTLLDSKEQHQRKSCFPDGGDTEELKKESGSNRLQYTSIIILSLMSMAHGAGELWSSPALPYLKSEHSMTADEGSLIASLFNFGGLVGYVLYPLIVDRTGRKNSLLIFALPQIIAWAIIVFSKNVVILSIARFSSGIGNAATFAITVIYTGEIAEKNIRGSLILIPKISYSIGNLIVLISGAFLSYNSMNLILTSIPVIFILTFPFMPETPYFYLMHGKEGKAIESLSKLRGMKDPIFLESEISRMKESVTESKRSKKYTFRKLFDNKRNRKAFLIVAILKSTLGFSGMHAIGAYTQEIFSYTGFFLDAKYATVVLALVVFLCVLSTLTLADKIDRRLLLLYSGIICSVCLGISGLFFFLKEYVQLTDLSFISWMPLIFLIIFRIGYLGGLTVLTCIFSSEIFSVEVKSLALSLLHILREFISFLVKLGFERTVRIFGIYSVFWGFSVCCLVFSIISFSIMPETKGKTLEEIQELLD